MDTPVLRFAPLDAGAAPLERLRSDCEAALQRALTAATTGDAAADCTLVLPHRLTTLLTHVFPRGLAALGRVAECVELTDELARVRSRTVVYVAHAQVEDVRAIATHAGLLLSVEPKERAFVLLVLGHWTPMCAEALGHQQLTDVFHIEQVDAGFVPLDSDLVTLGRERCLYDCVVQGNKSVLVDLAAALHQLQRLYGTFDHIKYKGDLSAFVFQRLMEMEPHADDAAKVQPAEGEARPNAKKKTKRHKAESETSHTLVLIDRNVDLASVLSTPLTFEALVDELFESRDGFATLPSQPTTHTEEPAQADQMLPLNASDSIFQRVRGLNIQAVSSGLNVEASTVKTKFDHFRATSSTASTAEVHEFVKSVPQIKAKQESLERLVALTETVEATTNSRSFRTQWQLERAIMDLNLETDDVDAIFNDLEDMVFRHAPLLTVLRVVCLYSVVHNGLPRDAFDRLRMRLIQTYGHELVFSFENLERIGLLREATVPTSLLEAATSGGSVWEAPSASPFTEITSALRAIDLDVDPLDPGNMAFVTSGYAPISCLLVEELLKHSNWEAIDAVMNKLAGPRAEIKTKSRKPTKTSSGEATKTIKQSDVSNTKPQVLVVCFVGGVTYMEIAALRWLSQFYPSHQIVIAGTSVVNGLSFLQEVLERIPSTT